MPPRLTQSQPPFAGVTVLDLSRLLPGGLCSLSLADLGARVIKIEEVGVGDFYREQGGASLLGEGYFEALNRGKESLSLNLKSREGRRILLQLVRKADVVMESFRPGSLQRLGLGFNSLRRANRRIILCSITGYGQNGPKARLAGHDLNYQSDAGLLSLFGEEGKRPSLPLLQIADLAGGALYGAFAIAAALYRRQKRGEGAWIDLAMTEGVASLVGMQLAAAQVGRKPPPRGKQLLAGGAASYNIYETKDHRYVALAALEPKFWQVFCKQVGLAEGGDTGFGPPVFSSRLKRKVAAVVKGRTARFWQRFAQDYDVCLSVVRPLLQVLADPHFKARRLFLQRGRTYLKSPLVWNGRRYYARSVPPRFGGETRKILRTLGYRDADLVRLRRNGVI